MRDVGVEGMGEIDPFMRLQGGIEIPEPVGTGEARRRCLVQPQFDERLGNRLLAFQKFRKKKIEFADLDFNFYESFFNYLTYDHSHMRRNISIRGLKKNSIGTSIKQLRIFVLTG